MDAESLALMLRLNLTASHIVGAVEKEDVGVLDSHIFSVIAGDKVYRVRVSDITPEKESA